MSRIVDFVRCVGLAGVASLAGVRKLAVGSALAASVSVACTSPALAEHSNRNEVRQNLESGGWHVVWGKNFTEADWAEGTASIVESIAAENPGPFLRWFNATLNENFAKIESNVPGATRAMLGDWVLQSLKAKRVITFNGAELEAGFATYDRWDVVSYDEPRTRKTNHFPFFEAYTERVERRVNLPNWHQFYIRFRLHRNNQHSGQATSTHHTVWVGSSTVGSTRIQKEGNVWVEYCPNAGARFVERGSDADFFYLYDQSRDMTIALGASQMFWRVGNGSFNLIHDGKWVN